MANSEQDSSSPDEEPGSKPARFCLFSISCLSLIHPINAIIIPTNQIIFVFISSYNSVYLHLHSILRLKIGLYGQNSGYYNEP